MADEELPGTSTTPPECRVVGMRIQAALLPDWFEEVKSLVGLYGRRMAVIEKPDEWVCHIEIELAKVPLFNREITLAWERFVDKRKAEGNWDDPDLDA